MSANFRCARRSHARTAGLALALATGAIVLTSAPAALASAPPSLGAAAAAGASGPGPLAILPSSQSPGLVTMPAPPSEPGCYWRETDVWQRVACETPAYIRAHVPYPESEDGVVSVSADGSRGPSFTEGTVGIGIIVAGPETDSTYGPDAFSIQDNTYFTGNNAQLDGVQFTDESRPGQPDSVCVVPQDVTTGQYWPSCTPAPYALPRGLLDGQLAQITGMVNPYGNLVTEAFLSWAYPRLYAAVAPDRFGLAGRWHNVSGSILGFGHGSQATFKTALVRTFVLASNCPVSLGGPCPYEPPLLGHVFNGYSPADSDTGSTIETNNLIPVIGLPPAHLPSIFWIDLNRAGIAYASTTTGTCPPGSLPPLCDPN
jgi:hypothetical protein